MKKYNFFRISKFDSLRARVRNTAKTRKATKENTRGTDKPETPKTDQQTQKTPTEQKTKLLSSQKQEPGSSKHMRLTYAEQQYSSTKTTNRNQQKTTYPQPQTPLN